MRKRPVLKPSTSDKISCVLPAERPHHRHTPKCVVTLFDDGYTPLEISRRLKIPLPDVRDVVRSL